MRHLKKYSLLELEHKRWSDLGGDEEPAHRSRGNSTAKTKTHVKSKDEFEDDDDEPMSHVIKEYPKKEQKPKGVDFEVGGFDDEPIPQKTLDEMSKTMAKAFPFSRVEKRTTKMMQTNKQPKPDQLFIEVGGKDPIEKAHKFFADVKAKKGRIPSGSKADGMSDETWWLDGWEMRVYIGDTVKIIATCS